MEALQVAIAIIVKEGLVLVAQRKADASLGGYWEFPGGKIKTLETPRQCAVREVMEEVGLGISVVKEMPVIEYPYPARPVQIHPFICTVESGQESAIECAQLRWVGPHELTDYQFPPANDDLLPQIASHLSDSGATTPA